MRLIRLADTPVVVHIRHKDDVLVAVPARLSESDILTMASLILSEDEYAELSTSLTSDRLTSPHD